MALRYIEGGKSSVIFGYETGGTVVTAKGRHGTEGVRFQ